MHDAGSCYDVLPYTNTIPICHMMTSACCMGSPIVSLVATLKECLVSSATLRPVLFGKILDLLYLGSMVCLK